VLLVYVQYTGVCKESWIPWNKECLYGWLPYLKQTLLLGGNFYVEWISYEISIFVVGALNNEFVLGAHGIAINLTIALFTIPLGNNIAMQTFIGNAVGQGSKYRAQKFMVAGFALNTIFSTINTFLMLVFNKEIAAFFTNDEETRAILQNILFIYSLAHIPDTFASHCGGVLRTLGREKDVFLTYMFCYMAVAFNCQWIFGVALDYGYVAIWISTNCGMYLMLGLLMWKLMKLDWGQEIEKLREEATKADDDLLVYIELKQID